MDITAIASMSMEMSMASTQQSVNIAMTKKAMNLQETQAAQLIDQMNNLTSPASFGHKLDVLA